MKQLRLHWQKTMPDEYHPKSGWGNPVIEKDICIGDDIERLYNIHSVVCGISEPDIVCRKLHQNVRHHDGSTHPAGSWITTYVSILDDLTYL